MSGWLCEWRQGVVSVLAYVVGVRGCLGGVRSGESVVGYVGGRIERGQCG